MARVLLLLPTATYRAADFLAAAARLGTDVVVASEHRQALSPAMGERALVVSLRDPDRAADAIVARAARLRLDAVIGVDDQGVRAAALAAHRLGLRGNPPEAVARTRDKAAMRAALAAAGVSQPGFALASASADVAEVAQSVGLPVVVKPLMLTGSRGVIRADSAAAAATAAARIRRIVADAGEDAAAPLLVERYVPGAEVALEALVRDGRLEPLATFDKPDPLEGPFFEETIYVTPSRQSTATLAAVEQAAAAAASALGLRDGPVHAELRVAPNGRPMVLELAARSIGGLCARSLRFGLGVSLEELILRHALGLPLDNLAREQAAAGVMMLPIERAGVLEAIGGEERARAVAGIAGLVIAIPRGGSVSPLPEGDRYLGFLFAKGDNPAGVEAALRAAHRELDVRIAPAQAAAPA